MFQKIIAEIAVDPLADGLADVGKIDNSNIDIASFRFAGSETIDLRQRHGNFASGTLALL